MDIELWELQNIIKAAAKEAVEQFILHQNPSEDEINEREAHREFGRAWVMNKLATGELKPPKRRGVHKNSPKVYSRSELTALKFGCSPLLSALYKGTSINN